MLVIIIFENLKYEAIHGSLLCPLSGVMHSPAFRQIRSNLAALKDVKHCPTDMRIQNCTHTL
jgi:hypothetical protein